MKSTGKTRRGPARIPRVDIGEFVRWYQLRALARLLNGDGPPELVPVPGDLRALALQVVIACVGRQAMAAVPVAAAAPFNRLASGVPFTFSLAPVAGTYDDLAASRRREQRQIVLWPGSDSGLIINCQDARGAIVKLLVDYVGHPSPERLKCCAQCLQWFVDQTRNNTRLRCSVACTWRWWSRDRRRQAGHAVARRRSRRPPARRTRSSRRPRA